jgi:PAS domain S-box-containing protein
MSDAQLRILHVEDNPTDAEMALRELRKAGLLFEARRVETRDAYLAAIADFRPDLIISDYRLPAFDGMQALLLAKDHAPDVPFIITTGSVNEETAVECMRAGAADYVLKEQLGRLGTAVRSALDRQRLFTERRRALESLRTSQMTLRALLDSSPDATLLLERDGSVISCNAAVAQEFGRPIREIVGHSIFDLMPAEVAAARRAQLESACALGRPVRHRDEARGRIVDVIVVPILAEGGRAARLSVFVRDVTDLEHAQKALARSELYFRSIIENSLDVTVVLAPDGRILYVSPAIEKMLDIRPADLQGSLAFDLIHPEDRSRVQDSFLRAQADGTRVEQQEFRLRHRDGSWRTISTKARLLDPDTGIAGVIVNGRDISERLQLEAQLNQSQKMEAIGRLAGGVAHDFNNLLTVIQGYGEMLTESLKGDVEKQESMGEIVKAAQRAAALTRQLLAFSRQQVLETRVLDVGDVVAETERMLRRLIGEDIEVAVVKAEGLGRVKADPGQVSQVLLNLAVNARDAMPDGGRLTIELLNVSLDAPLGAGQEAIPPGRYVEISMTDTGCGIDADTLRHIFEPFFTTKEKGTGLGLATVYGIVRQSGGYVAVRSAPGAGTTFRTYWPRCDEPAKAVQGSSVRSLRGTETILVAEDDPSVRSIAQALLRKQGYTVLVAGGGDEALELLARYPHPVHVLLADVVMPRMNGRELASRIAATHPAVKAVLMSGYAAEVLPRFEEAGVAGFLPKPFTERTLAAKIREVLDEPRRNPAAPPAGGVVG